MKNIIRYMTALLSVILFLSIASCSSKELSRNKAENLLEKSWMDLISKKGNPCSLQTFTIKKKPEFASLSNNEFCEFKINVTGIARTGETAAKAEYELIQIPKHNVIKEILNAFEKMEERLSTIKPKKLWVGYEYTDPTDGQVLVSLKPDITNTDQWKAFQKSKQALSDMLKRKEIIIDKDTQKLELYDDGWRVVPK